MISHLHAATAGVCALPILLGGAVVASHGLEDTFTITLEEAVSDGLPGPGAGNIEDPGATDVYTISIATPTEVWFQEVSGGCGIRWSCEAPDGTMLFDNNVICSGHPGDGSFNQIGDYTITVWGHNDATGTYAFTVWERNPDDVFTIAVDDTVSDGAPGVGAGNIEEPGAHDVYEITIASPQDVYFDELSGQCGIRWTCEAPDGSTIFQNNAICSGDPKTHTLDQIGTWSITIDSNGDATGTYSFRTWSVEPPDEFVIAIDDTVSEDVPGPGAGNIEEPGSIDIYTFEATAGQTVYFDELDGNCNIQWTCTAPDGTNIFQNNAMCSGDPGDQLLDQTGTWTITVKSGNGGTDTYSFAILAVETADEFDLELEETVSDGVPGAGAGNIEEPGSVDLYNLEITAPTTVFFDELSGPCGLVWTCTAPDGSTLFSNNVICSGDPGLHELTQVGIYVIRAEGSGSGTGTYSFIVWEVGAPDTFTIDFDELVEDGDPGAGAGNIEEPGDSDIYTLAANAGDLACFEEIDGPCGGIRWSCTMPDGTELFDDVNICSSQPGKFELPQTGDYTITVYANNDTTGAYSIIVNTGRTADIDGDCQVATGDLLALLAAWGTCPKGEDCPADLDMDGEVNVNDLLTLLAEWG